MLDRIDPIQYQNVRLQKSLGKSPEMIYENNDKVIYRKLSNKEYYLILEQLSPNSDFALPDRMIQDLIHDNKFIPKFIQSKNYTLQDLTETINDGNEMTFMEKIKKREEKREKRKMNKKRRKIIKPITMKKKNKLTTRQKLLKKTKSSQKTKKRKNKKK